MLHSTFSKTSTKESIDISDNTNNTDKEAVSEEVLSKEIVFSEINNHKRAPLLFPPPSTVKVGEERSLEFDFIDRDGKKITGSVKIQPASGLTPYTTTSYDVLLGLTVLWRDAGGPSDPLAASFNQLWLAMGHKNRPGSKEIKLMLDQLDILHRNFFAWSHSYITGDERIMDRESYNVLKTLDIHEVRDEKSGRLKKGGFSFTFHETHVTNLRNPQTNIPVNIAARVLIRNQTAKSLHPFVERTLSGFVRDAHKKRSKHINNLTMTTKTLIEKHLTSYDPQNYTAPSKQERLCISLAKGLTDIPLSIEGYKILGEALPSASKSSSWMVSFSAVRIEDDEPTNTPKMGKVDYDVYDLLFETLGDENNIGFYTTLARTYDHNLISRAIGLWKESLDQNSDIQNKHAYFTATLRRVVEEAGLKWIKE